VKALTVKGYDVNYAWGMNKHGSKMGGAIRRYQRRQRIRLTGVIAKRRTNRATPEPRTDQHWDLRGDSAIDR
jgi:hypothetical protein